MTSILSTESGDLYVDLNSPKVEVCWQDRARQFLASKGSVILSNLMIFCIMLYYSYTANPADPDLVSRCQKGSWSDPGILAICRTTYPGLVGTQENGIGQRIATISAVGLPIMLYIFCHYSQDLALVIRAYGVEPRLALLSTLMGLFIFVAWIIRACYCFGGLNSPYAFCATSKQKSYRLLNNMLIQVLLMLVSCFLLGGIADYILIKDASAVWTARWNNLVSGVTYNKCKRTVVYLFDPPPYQEIEKTPSPSGV